jgi:hypothetical protein
VFWRGVRAEQRVTRVEVLPSWSGSSDDDTSFFEASLRCLRLAPFLDLVFLGENLAPPEVGDRGILVPPSNLDSRRLFCTSGGLCLPMVMIEETSVLVTPVKVVVGSTNILRFSSVYVKDIKAYVWCNLSFCNSALFFSLVHLL